MLRSISYAVEKERVKPAGKAEEKTQKPASQSGVGKAMENEKAHCFRNELFLV